jgi:hypothetical protein
MYLCSGPYCPLGTVPRTYDFFKVYEEMEGRQKQNLSDEKYENLIQNKIHDFEKYN